MPDIERRLLQLKLTGLDLGKIQNAVDDCQQRLAACTDGLDKIALLVGQVGFQQQIGHPQHAADRRPNLVAHMREQLRFRPISRVQLLEQPRVVNRQRHATSQIFGQRQIAARHSYGPTRPPRAAVYQAADRAQSAGR